MIRIERHRFQLALLWLASFSLAVSLILIAQLSGNFEYPVTAPLEQLSRTYAPLLGIVVAFVSVRSTQSKPASVQPPPINFLMALGTSLIWNGVVLLITTQVLLGAPIEDFGTTLDGTVGRLNWLVAPALGYYFAKDG